jgi:hypothetical protein
VRRHVGRRAASGGGASVSARVTTSRADGPANGGSPASIS